MFFSASNVITADATVHAYTILTQTKAANSIVTYLQHKDGKQYLLKEKKDHAIRQEVASPVCDVLGACIAESIGVACNRVTLIQKNDLVFNNKKLATLHTIVPGIKVEDSCYKHIHIKQYIKRGRPLYSAGLTWDVIQNMAQHKDLPAICALDTYIGNTDRCQHNIFYDASHDRFWVIDMDCAFNYNLCHFAFLQIKRLLHSPLAYDETIYRALKIYNDTIKQLIVLWPIEKMIQTFNALCAEAYQDVPQWWARMIKRSIQVNCDDAHKLVRVLDAFLEAYSP